MAKPKAPLFSLSASGSIGDKITYAKRAGTQYAKAHSQPTGKPTAAQLHARAIHAALMSNWKAMTTLERGPWDTFAKFHRMTPTNAYLKHNLSAMTKADATIMNYTPSVESLGALPCTYSHTSFVPFGAGILSFTYKSPETPPGWAQLAYQWIIATDQDPLLFINAKFHTGQTALTGDEVTFSAQLNGIESGKTYLSWAWIKWQHPTKGVCYSSSATAPPYTHP